VNPLNPLPALSCRCDRPLLVSDENQRPRCFRCGHEAHVTTLPLDPGEIRQGPKLECADARCDVTFSPRTHHQKFCSKVCNERDRGSRRAAAKARA